MANEGTSGTATGHYENVSTQNLYGPISTDDYGSIAAEKGHQGNGLPPRFAVDSEYALYVRYWVYTGGSVPVCAMGIVGNLVSFWVWHKENTYNPTTFLFKYLAAWDLLYLSTFVAWFYLDFGRVREVM